METNIGLKEVAFVKFMQVTKPLDEVEEIHGCINLRWSTDDEIDRTLSIMDDDSIPSPWYGLVEVCNIISVVQVIRQHYSIKEFKTEEHWSKHRFSLNRFARVCSSMPEVEECRTG